jgi:hypothetical protein
MSTLSPLEVSTDFWAIIDKANRERAKMALILELMTREEIISFHNQFLNLATAILGQEYIQYMDPGTSEDGADDVTRWIVGQGRDYYLDIYEHPQKTPASVEPHSKQQVYYEIPRVFFRRFEEDIWSAEED